MWSNDDRTADPVVVVGLRAAACAAGPLLYGQ